MRHSFCLLFFSIFALSLQAQEITIEKQNITVNASLRGLSVVSEDIVWASGTGGTILRTSNSGKSWHASVVPGADTLDFRDIKAFSADEALIMSSGQPARIYLTTNGGQHWQLVYEDSTGKAFFDALAFWNEQEGMAMSDPVDGQFLLLKTRDGGRNWTKIQEENLPAALEGEGGFAASGTNMVTHTSGLVLIGTGGPQVRVLRSSDFGHSWQAIITPLSPETPSTGIYSIALQDSLNGIAVGGDYTKPNATSNHLLITSDGGQSWQRIDQSGLRGYRSGSTAIQGFPNTYIAVGTNGIDLSRDGGRSWQALSDIGMHAIRFSPNGKVGWASGSNGKILKLTIINP